ncbi:MAG: hypothetical protein U0805_03085 [Pirellulales bacterium]
MRNGDETPGAEHDFAWRSPKPDRRGNARFLTVLGNAQQRTQVAGAIRILPNGCFIAKVFSHQGCTRSGAPYRWMKPARDLDDLLPEQLERMLRLKMLHFVQEHVPEVLNSAFDQEARQHNRGTVNLPAEWAFKPIVNHNVRHFLIIERDLCCYEEVSNFIGRHCVTMVQEAAEFYSLRYPAQQRDR